MCVQAAPFRILDILLCISNRRVGMMLDVPFLNDCERHEQRVFDATLHFATVTAATGQTVGRNR